MNRRFSLRPSALGAWMLPLLLPLALPSPGSGEEQKRPVPDREQLIAAAREIMQAQTYCALITLDEAGRPQPRTMNPFAPDEEMTVWFATNTRSRKVAQIRKDPRVALYYADHSKATGYVALTGRAFLVDDANEIRKRKRAYWDDAFEPGLKNLVLIKVVPERLEVLNYARGALNEQVTWRTPSVGLSAGEAQRPKQPKQ